MVDEDDGEISSTPARDHRCPPPAAALFRIVDGRYAWLAPAMFLACDAADDAAAEDMIEAAVELAR